MTFLLGIAASLIAGAFLLAITHPADIRYAVRRRQRESFLDGDWFEYHLSRDPDAGPSPLWVQHRKSIHVSVFGRISGRSSGMHSKRFSYQLTGTVRDTTMRFTLANRDTRESPASFLYPNLLAKDRLVGILVGEDFAHDWYASPTILTREPLDEATRERLVRHIRFNLSQHTAIVDAAAIPD